MSPPPPAAADGVIIRDLVAGDVDALLAFINALIAEDTYIDLFGPPLVRVFEAAFVKDRVSAMRRGDAVMRLATSGQRVVGTGELRRLTGRRSHIAELGLSVAEDHRGMGIGRRLMDDVHEQAARLHVRRLVLRVFATNERALHLYRTSGWEEVGRLPGMVQHRGADVDEIWMTRPL